MNLDGPASSFAKVTLCKVGCEFHYISYYIENGIDIPAHCCSRQCNL